MDFLTSGDSFGKNLTRLRKRRGLTRLKLAALAEISVFDMIELENGTRRKIPAEMAVRLCELLHTNLETLFQQK